MKDHGPITFGEALALTIACVVVLVYEFLQHWAGGL